MDKEAYSFDNGTLTLKGKIRSGSAKVDHTTETGQEIFTVTEEGMSKEGGDTEEHRNSGDIIHDVGRRPAKAA